MDITWLLITALGGFGVTAVLGFWLIPLLHRLKFGQTIREIGPKWHKNKQGTPTMGGIMFISGIAALCSPGSSGALGWPWALGPSALWTTS